MQCAHGSIDQANVSGGRIAGHVTEGVTSFKGIPFAAPPVGQLRWKAPQAVVPWRGIRNADSFAPACIQPWGDHEQTRPSEDCLYLNVWTAASSARERRAVIVWLHGGGLVGGMSWEKVSDGTTLAREGVVVVTIAYRLGALGFLAHPELTREHGTTSGNYGLLDMIAALQWVQANIAQFGGDPSRVTVMGGSAGAFSVSMLAGSPRAKGLYARAVALGGAAFLPTVGDDPQQPFFAPSLTYGEKQGEAFFAKLGARDLRAARAVSAVQVAKAAEGAAPAFTVVRDGNLVPGANSELFAQGRFNDTPILIGYTSDEAGEPPAEVTAAALQAELEKLPCKHAHAGFLGAYPPITNDIQARTVSRYARRDQTIGWATWTWARLQAAKGRHPAYVYFFDVHGPEQPHGAPHATEYPFVFGNFFRSPTAHEQAVSKLLRRSLINLAEHGNPNGALAPSTRSPPLPVWKEFDEDSPHVMVLDESPTSRPWPSLAGVKAADAFFRCFVQLAPEERRIR